MSFDIPAALLVGGSSRRMGRPKADLPWQGTTLAAWQAARLSRLFPEVWIVAKRGQHLPVAPGRRLDEAAKDPAALHGLIRALEEARGKVFVLAVDLPFVTDALVSRIAQEGARSQAPAFLPESEGRLQPLAAVWDPAILPEAHRRRSEGLLSLTELARAAGAEILPADAFADLNPGGNAFRNLNTPADLITATV